MGLIQTKVRLYDIGWTTRRVKVWKLGPFVVWRKVLRRAAAR